MGHFSLILEPMSLGFLHRLMTSSYPGTLQAFADREPALDQGRHWSGPWMLILSPTMLQQSQEERVMVFGEGVARAQNSVDLWEPEEIRALRFLASPV